VTIGMMRLLKILQKYYTGIKISSQQSFSEMKGIARELGEMNISLKPYANPIRQRPYRLNLKYKEKVNAGLERMIEAGIIELVAEYEWINPMVV
jgi:hypothetical protein